MPSAISPAWSKSSESKTACTKSSRSLAKSRDATSKTANNIAAIINSPLLFEMLGSLPANKKHTILDISQANNSSLTFFSDYWCKLFINNAINSIHKLNPELINTPHKWHRALVNAMGFYKKDKIELDIIFLWDLVNYLEPDKLKGLIDYIHPQCTNNTCLHIYIFNSELISEAPSNYQIQSNKKVAIYPQQHVNKINGPTYNLNDLNKMLSPFNLDHSVMLSSGVQEYIFRLS